MKIAITGSSGTVGRPVVAGALVAGHSVVSIDRVEPTVAPHSDLRHLTLDLADYDALVSAFAGCDAIIHLAAIPQPFGFPDHVVHNNNVVGSYNVLRAAVECGITRVCQASSVNAMGLSFSRAPRFDYFPIDEQHPTYNEEPYGLSKWICEAQADSIARRHADMRIASLRFHLVVEDSTAAAEFFKGMTLEEQGKHLWAYTRTDMAIAACLNSLEADFTGHEVFFVIADHTFVDVPTPELLARYYPAVPLRAALTGHAGFFTSQKAVKVLGLTG